MLGPVQGVRNKPWPELVDELRDGMSQDDLAYEARRHGAPATLTGSWVSQLKKGTRPITIEIFEGLAGALNVPPETFAEYRLAIARLALDESHMGLDGALVNLRLIEEAATAAGQKLPRSVKEDLPKTGRRGRSNTSAAPSEGRTSAAAPKRKRASRKRAA